MFQELRYQFINYYIRKSGYMNILDVGCGYSPRTLVFLPEGYRYTGIELPDVVSEVTAAQKECLDEKYQAAARYEAVKLTDIEGLEKAAEDFEGPVCIALEGVLMYFTAEELEKTLTAFRNILEKNGGCIITPDYMSNQMLKICLTSYSGKLLGRLLLRASYAVVKKYTPRTDDEYMDPVKQFADDSDIHAIEFFEKNGFKVKRVPLYPEDMEMKSLEGDTDKNRLCKASLQRLYGWIAEVDDKEEEEK